MITKQHKLSFHAVFGLFWFKLLLALSCENTGYLVKIEQKSLFVLLFLSLQNAANWKGKHYVYKSGFGIFAKIVVVSLVNFISSIKKKIILCVTVNQKMFESCQKICIQVNGDMNFCLKFVGSDAFHMWRWKRTQEASPLLLHEHYTSVTYFETKLALSPLAYTAHFKWQSEGETSCFPSAAAFLWAQRWSLVWSMHAAVPRSECWGC